MTNPFFADCKMAGSNTTLMADSNTTSKMEISQ